MANRNFTVKNMSFYHKGSTLCKFAILLLPFVIVDATVYRPRGLKNFGGFSHGIHNILEKSSLIAESAIFNDDHNAFLISQFTAHLFGKFHLQILLVQS